MEKILQLGMVAALVALAQAAHAEGQAFVSASAGVAKYSHHGDNSYSELAHYGIDASIHRDDKDVAYSVTGGYRWAVDDGFSIGPEVGYVNLGDSKSNSVFTSPGFWTQNTRGKATSQAAILGANAKWDLGNQWTFDLRTGFLHSWTRIRSSTDGIDTSDAGTGAYSDRFSASSHGNGFYGAMSIGYDFTRNIGAALGYEHYHYDYKVPDHSLSENVGVWSVSVEYRF